jgi:hypothetical protein
MATVSTGHTSGYQGVQTHYVITVPRNLPTTNIIIKPAHPFIRWFSWVFERYKLEK